MLTAWFTLRVLALKLLSMMQKIQEVKEGGQKKKPKKKTPRLLGGPGAPCVTVAAVRTALIPSPQPSSIFLSPHADQLLSASVWGAG